MEKNKEFWEALKENCHKGNQTAIHEKSTTFNLGINSTESLSWYHIDTKTNLKSNIYNFYYDAQERKVCDYIGIYTSNKHCILLVEIKSGSNLKDGVIQLDATFTQLKHELKKCESPISLVLAHRGATPDNVKIFQKKYKEMKDVKVKLVSVSVKSKSASVSENDKLAITWKREPES